MVDDDVKLAWLAIEAWLAGHAPTTAAHLGMPASTSELQRVEHVLHQELPHDLTAWWRLSCGATGFVEAWLLPPGYVPVSVNEAIATWQMMLEVRDKLHGADIGRPSQLAGSLCTEWASPWLPVASNGGGNYLFVDLRHGPLRGCVMEFDEYEGATLPPLWPSVQVMLTEVAEALTEGTDIQGVTPEVNEDGTLNWV